MIWTDVTTEMRFCMSLEVSFLLPQGTRFLILAMLVRMEVTLLKPVNEIQADSGGRNKIWPFADLRGG